MDSPRRPYSFVLVFALLVAVGLVVWLSLRQVEVNKAYAELRRLATQPHEGYAVPGFVAQTITGDTLTIGEGGSLEDRTILFVLTTTCPYCLATLPVWTSLADSVERSGVVRVVALALDSVEAVRRYAAAHHLLFRMATFPSEKLRRLYRAGSVPQTVVLDGAGTVRYAHIGMLKPGPKLDSVYLALKPIGHEGLSASSAKRSLDSIPK